MHTTSRPPRRGRTYRALAIAAGFALVAAACGGDDDDTGGASEASSDTAASSEETASATADSEMSEDTASEMSSESSAESSDSASVETTEPAEPAGDPEPGPGFDGTTIRIGVMTALSGPAALIGKELANGQQVYVDYLNAELGGVAGKYPVEIQLEDHLYETATAVQKYQQMKDNVVMFSQVMGTAEIQALLPLLDEDGLVVSPASQDAIWVRQQQLLPVIEPYQIDVINAMSYYLGDGGGSTDDTICAVIQNDVYGEAGLEGLEYAAENMGFEIATVTRYASGDQDFTAQVTELSNTGCDMVFATALPTEFAGITGKSAQSEFAPRWIAQSPAWVDELAAGDLGPYLEENVWVVALGREWGDPDSTEMTAMLDRVAKYKPDQQPDYYFTFGYLQAWAAHQVLEAAVARGDLSREGIVEAMNGLPELDFGDLIPPYIYGPPEDRDPPRGSTVFDVDTSKPFSLGALATAIVSPEAEAYEFPAAD